MTLGIITMNNDNMLHNVLIIYSQKVYTMHSRTIYLVTITYILKNITSHKKTVFFLEHLSVRSGTYFIQTLCKHTIPQF